MEVFEPRNTFIKKYVTSIYIIEQKKESIKYMSYPSPNISIGLFRNAEVTTSGNDAVIRGLDGKNYVAIACNRLYYPVQLQYEEQADEIAINFTPVGFVAFTQTKHREQEPYFEFSTWNNELEKLFDDVFFCKDPQSRLHIVETFLIDHYVAVGEEHLISKTISLLSDFTHNYTMNEIAAENGVHYKDLYRKFKRLVGCSPAHYRKITRFRQAIYLKLNSAQQTTLTELCYHFDYTDQSYFIKQFYELTGEAPGDFFKGISNFKGKVILKFS